MNSIVNNKDKEWKDLGKQRLTELLNKNQELEKKVELVTNSFNNLKRQYSLEVSKLQNEITEGAIYYNHKINLLKDHHCVELNSVEKAKEEETKRLLDKVRDLETIGKRLTEENSEVNKRYHSQKTSFNKNLTEIEILITSREKEFEREEKRLKAEIEETNRIFKKKYEEDMDDLNRVIEKLKRQEKERIEEYSKERLNREKTIQELETEIKRINDKSNETTKRMKEDISGLRKNNVDVNFKFEDLTLENQRMKEELEASRKKKKDSELAIKELHEENERLKDTVRQQECNIDKMDRLAYGKLVTNTKQAKEQPNFTLD
eukprot:CAMPEP_0170537758 /NCGR_PEP_ID=MMETSP0209-20121228/102912_1 /TAXON_ID=665100 ORGANISM="Litonotus pictus, Strain P1" /NCGR_SAMPLE_ID=MMETSP0209 /ASSEMBLY_ACC=CAM_ASM_000301 /LENGTH=318 /DNA_ID=CAMNT_0010839329 /DNA_START=832 /DNA_END=1788 /DNA_ORIENTATION=+